MCAPACVLLLDLNYIKCQSSVFNQFHLYLRFETISSRIFFLLLGGGNDNVKLRSRMVAEIFSPLNLDPNSSVPFPHHHSHLMPELSVCVCS